MMVLNKERINLFLSVITTLAACVLVFGNFVIKKHITLPSICLAVLGGGSLLHFIVARKLSFAFDWKILACFWGIFFSYVLISLINNLSAEDAEWILKFKSIILGYSAAVFIINWHSKKQYYAVFMSFVLTNTVFACITIYNYYDIIYTHHGAGLHPTWINFIDMMYDKIIPFQMYHHLLSVFTVFSINLICECLHKKMFLINKYEKYLQISLLIFLVGFLHFLSARIGILLFYIGLIVILVYFTYTKKIVVKYSLAALASMILILITSYAYVPTFRIKADLTANEILFYVVSDANTIENGPQYRLKPFFGAFKSIAKFPLKGIGNDQVKPKAVANLMPHNIYVFYAMFYGVPLAILIALFTFLPLVIQKMTVNSGLVFIYLLHILYSFTDNTLELKVYFYFFSFWMPFMFCYHNFIHKKTILNVNSNNLK